MTRTDAVVRVMHPDEWDTVVDVSVRAFGGDEHIRGLLGLLRSSWAYDDDLSLVAVVGGRIMGQVLLTHGFVDASRELVDVAVLSPIGVLPEHQGDGIGSALVRDALAAAGARGIPAVFLEGSPVYYGRFGFEQADKDGFRPPSNRIPPASFQVRILDAWEPWMRGRLVYPDAFWQADAVGLRLG